MTPRARPRIPRSVKWGAVALIGLGTVACVSVTRPHTDHPHTVHPHTAPAESGMRLVWHDEFSGSTLSTSKWRIENNSTFGDGNSELACLKSRERNVSLRGGSLDVRAIRETRPVVCGQQDARFPKGRAYTSAMISTQGKTAWHTGTFEIRAKLPTGVRSQGLWPAFWLKPQAGQPGTGEIDVFEAIGSATSRDAEAGVVHQTVWSGGAGSAKKTATVRVHGGPDAGFHTYAVRWQENSIAWYVDGKRTFACDEHNAPWLARALRGKFFLRINLAVGGSWPGAPTDRTELPAGMVVDWARVYQNS